MNNLNIYIESNPNPNSLKFVANIMLVNEGIVKEVSNFLKLKVKKELSANKIIGISEIINLLNKKNSLEECLFATNHVGTKFTDLNVRYTGCAALDLAYVANGRFDGFFQHELKIWDIAAGIILIKEAGGIINDIDLSKTKNLDVITSSPNIHQKMIEKINNF